MPDAPDGRTPGQLSPDTDPRKTNRRPAVIAAVVVALLAVVFVVWQTSRSDAGSDQNDAIRAAIAVQSMAVTVSPPVFTPSDGPTSGAQPTGIVADPNQPAPDVEVDQEGQPFVIDPHFAQCTDGTLASSVCDRPVFSAPAVDVTITSVFGASRAGDTVPAIGFTFRSFDAEYVTKRKGDPTGMSWKVTRDGIDINDGGLLKQTNVYYSASSNEPGFISFTASIHDSPISPEGDAATVLEITDHGKTIWRYRLDDATVLN